MAIHPKISWCNKNGITIYPVPIKNNKKVLIEINDKGKIKTGKKIIHPRRYTYKENTRTLRVLF